MPHYCQVEGCLCTYPCGIHKEPSFTLRVPTGIPRRKRYDFLTEIVVIPLPCSHNMPQPENDRGHLINNFNAKCPDCSAEYNVKVSSTVAEILRLN